MLRQVSRLVLRELTDLRTSHCRMGPIQLIARAPCSCTDERLLAAAKNDNESLLESALEKLKDINGVDG